jgi:hypothetical protein
MTTVRVEGLDQLRRRLKGADQILLDALQPTIGGAALSLGMVAQANVPAASGELAASFFVDGAQMNEARKSVTATVGYTSPHAAFEHEGFHYGRKVSNPPKWLERAADGFRAAFRSAVKSAVKTAIQRLSAK